MAEAGDWVGTGPGRRGRRLDCHAACYRRERPHAGAGAAERAHDCLAGFRRTPGGGHITSEPQPEATASNDGRSGTPHCWSHFPARAVADLRALARVSRPAPNPEGRRSYGMLILLSAPAQPDPQADEK